ncbi:MAG: HNH endonuclease domain-containing protein [Bacteroidales bacterium]|nr:HNH endonuclease domain-containing protein [Bacteroidales bacterium]
MTRILGLDLGTNSLGWAVVEKENNQDFQLIDKGVRIFQEGVKIEKGIEGSKAAERTVYRSARRNKFRRRLRKIETLKVLSEYGYCPELSAEELNIWRYKKEYPKNELFRNWLLTDDSSEKHPYFFRDLAVTQKLDIKGDEDRYKLGRAFYHLVQRRGFLSNRLENTKENDGKVKQSIADITKQKGEQTLGQFFYQKYLKGEKIRDTYTHRVEHYMDEFNRICEFQGIPEIIRTKLYKAIFYQRPLKSQKGLIGKCVFETNKPRCSVSRPEFEEFRMLCFINNIKIKSPNDEKLRPLNIEERTRVIPRFFLHREHFDFEDLAKQLAPKKQYKYYKERTKNPEDWLFNYSMKATVSSCPVSARFKDMFGRIFIDDDFEYSKDKNGRTPKVISDTWHALYTFDSEEKLIEFADKHLEIDDEKKKQLLKIRLKQDFASLSLKAIYKILPYLREGLIYSHAVFLANMAKVLPDYIWENPDDRAIVNSAIKDIIENENDDKAVINAVNGCITNAKRNNEKWSDEAKEYLFSDLENSIVSAFGKNKYASFTEEKQIRILDTAKALLERNMPTNFGNGQHIKIKRIDEAVKEFLEDNFGENRINSDKIFHPSAIETYKPAKRAEDGNIYLGSPMTSSVRNPMAMRALHQLRIVVNELLKEGIIAPDTKINIEMSRGLLNANERAGLRSWQNEREKTRKEYIDKIKEFFTVDYEPSEDEVLKYQLWVEQNHKCIYTGEEIALHEFLGADPKYDIEHTIPRSLSYDNSQENKTLCENAFNRSIKKNRIPSELNNHDEILSRIEHWKEHVEKLEVEIEKTIRQSKGAVDKDQKDRAIQKRHQLSYERNYWRNKYSRFTMKDVPDGFKNSQIVDIGIITKYSRLYLKTVFHKVYTVKGSTVADFRIIWGLQEHFKKKERNNHVHHCIDAVTIACMDKGNYENLAKFYHDSEDAFLLRDERKPFVRKPWKTFSEDVKNIENEILISHYIADNLPKQSKRKLRKRGIIQYNKHGLPTYQKGDTVRGSLHKDTFYGAIEREVVNKTTGEMEKQIKYVVRKPIDGLDDSMIKHIVDERVREIVAEARVQEKALQKEIEALIKQRKNAEEWEEPELDTKIAMLKQKISLHYSLPNRNGDPVPIKKVRLYQPTVTNPLHLKKHRDKSQKSRKAYKEQFHVTNDGNYLMAIYEGKDKNGKVIRDFELINNIEAGEYFKLSVINELRVQGIEKYEGLIPKVKTIKKVVIPFKTLIKVGMMVILWEEYAEEVWDLEVEDLKRRLYKVIGLSIQRIKRLSGKTDNYATIVLRFHQEAKAASDLKVLDGSFRCDETYMAQRKMNHNQLNALFEGVDFKISPLGKISRLK